MPIVLRDVDGWREICRSGKMPGPVSIFAMRAGADLQVLAPLLARLAI